MKYEAVTVRKEGNIGILTFNQPDNYNRVNPQLAKDSCDALEELAQDKDVRAIIINGAGKNFCAGADFGRLKAGTTIHALMQYEGKSVAELQRRIADFPKGVVIMVQGQAIAGGAGIAMRSDMLVMAEDARIGASAINVGLSCLRGIKYLSAIVGLKRAKEMILKGRILSAQEALEWGLANRVVPAAKLYEAAMEEAQILASKSPLAIWMTKRAEAATRNMGIRDAEWFLDEHFNVLASSIDGREGLDAFSNNREPNWKFPYEY